jgi:hypothetical protein
MKIKQKQKLPKNLIVFTFGVWVIAGGHLSLWYEDVLKPTVIYPEKAYAEEIEEKLIEDTIEEVEEQKEVVLDETDIERKIKKTFPEESELALAIFKSESGLNPGMESTTDRMADGRPFSVGLAQINLTVHRLDGVKCYEAFEGRNYKAKVVDEDLYKKCIELAKDPDINLACGRGIYDRSGKNFGKWGGYTNKSYLNHL